MDLETSEVGGVVVVRVRGKLDAVGAPAFSDAIAETLAAAPQRLALDLTDAPYVSSAGLRVVIQVAKQLAPKGKLAVCGLNAGVAEVFRMAGFDKIMLVCDDAAAACRALG